MNVLCRWAGCKRRPVPGRNGSIHAYCEHHERALLRGAFG